MSNDELKRLGETLRQAETVGLPWDLDAGRPTAKHAARPEHRIQQIGQDVTDAIRLLLFTGCRLREILHLKWAYVDFERGMLFLPDSKTGRKAVVLASPALAVLAAIEKIDDYVIPGARQGQPRSDLKRPWARIVNHAGLAGLRLHDLRHSFGATGAGSGLGLPIIGKLMGHRSILTTSRYAHVAIDPQKIAADTIGKYLARGLIGSTEADGH